MGEGVAAGIDWGTSASDFAAGLPPTKESCFFRVATGGGVTECEGGGVGVAAVQILRVSQALEREKTEEEGYFWRGRWPPGLCS